MPGEGPISHLLTALKRLIRIVSFLKELVVSFYYKMKAPTLLLALREGSLTALLHSVQCTDPAPTFLDAIRTLHNFVTFVTR